MLDRLGDVLLALVSSLLRSPFVLFVPESLAFEVSPRSSLADNTELLSWERAPSQFRFGIELSEDPIRRYPLANNVIYEGRGVALESARVSVGVRMRESGSVPEGAGTRMHSLRRRAPT